LIRCIRTFRDEEHQITTVPLSVFIPTTTTIHGEISKQLPSPTNSSSRSTVVRSPSSSDVESPNEQLLTQTLLPQQQLDEEINTQQQSNIENQEKNNQSSSENG
jgi:hypothetical protein